MKATGKTVFGNVLILNEIKKNITDSAETSDT